MYEQPYRQYWRVLYPEFSDPKSTAYWYGKWKTAEMCMGLFDERQQARHQWIADGPRRGPSWVVNVGPMACRRCRGIASAATGGGGSPRPVQAG